MPFELLAVAFGKLSREIFADYVLRLIVKV